TELKCQNADLPSDSNHIRKRCLYRHHDCCLTASGWNKEIKERIHDKHADCCSYRRQSRYRLRQCIDKCVEDLSVFHYYEYRSGQSDNQCTIYKVFTAF